MWSKRDAATTLALATVFLVVAPLLFPPVGSPATTPDPAAAKIAHAFLKVERTAEHRNPAGPQTTSVACRHATSSTFRCHDIGVDASGAHVCVSFLARWNPAMPGVVQISPASLAYCTATAGPPA